MRLTGRVAPVTGATRGLGRAIAVEMAREGADVAVAGRDMEAATVTVEEIRAMGRCAVVLRTRFVPRVAAPGPRGVQGLRAE